MNLDMALWDSLPFPQSIQYLNSNNELILAHLQEELSVIKLEQNIRKSHAYYTGTVDHPGMIGDELLDTFKKFSVVIKTCSNKRKIHFDVSRGIITLFVIEIFAYFSVVCFC